MKIKRLTFKDFQRNDNLFNQELIKQIMQKDFCGKINKDVLVISKIWIDFLFQHMKQIKLSIYVAYYMINDNNPLVLAYLMAGPLSKSPNQYLTLYQYQYLQQHFGFSKKNNDILKNMNAKTKKIKKQLHKSQYIQLYTYCQNNSFLLKQKIRLSSTLFKSKYKAKSFLKNYHSAKNTLFYYFIYHLAHHSKQNKYKGIYYEMMEDPRSAFFVEPFLKSERFLKSNVFQKFFHQKIIMNKNISFNHLELTILKKYLQNQIKMTTDDNQKRIQLKNSNRLFDGFISWYQFYHSLNFQYVLTKKQEKAYFSPTSNTFPTFAMILYFKDIKWSLFAKQLIE